MPPEMKNLLITAPFVIVLIVLLIWLIRALVPSDREQARMYRKDKFELSGYEPMARIKKKEYAVITLGVVVIVLCVAMVGGLGYLVYSAGAEALIEDQTGLNTILTVIPAVILLILIITGSRSYIRSQHKTLQEYRQFQAARHKAISEYKAKREGKDKEEEKRSGARKTGPGVKRNVSQAQQKAADRHRRRIPTPKKKGKGGT